MTDLQADTLLKHLAAAREKYIFAIIKEQLAFIRWAMKPYEAPDTPQHGRTIMLVTHKSKEEVIPMAKKKGKKGGGC